MQCPALLCGRDSSDFVSVLRMLEAAALVPAVHLQSLSELERFRLQEIALYALQQRGLCTNIKPGETLLRAGPQGRGRGKGHFPRLKGNDLFIPGIPSGMCCGQ